MCIMSHGGQGAEGEQGAQGIPPRGASQNPPTPAQPPCKQPLPLGILAQTKDPGAMLPLLLCDLERDNDLLQVLISPLVQLPEAWHGD